MSHPAPGEKGLVVGPDTVVTISFVVVDDESGEEVDRVEPDAAVSFPVGRGKLMTVLEEGLLGARIGETRVVEVKVIHPVYRRRVSFVVTIEGLRSGAAEATTADCAGDGCGRCCGGSCGDEGG